MPKQKSHRGAAKRFSFTKTGKVTHKQTTMAPSPSSTALPASRFAAAFAMPMKAARCASAISVVCGSPVSTLLPA